jgi:hypothetical protein
MIDELKDRGGLTNEVEVSNIKDHHVTRWPNTAVHPTTYN